MHKSIEQQLSRCCVSNGIFMKIISLIYLFIHLFINNTRLQPVDYGIEDRFLKLYPKLLDKEYPLLLLSSCPQ